MHERVLIVEDDEKSRRLLVDLLGFHGYDVAAAESGELALEMLAGKLPDIALLDIQLPGIDGFALLGRLRALQDGRPIPIVAVTASVMDMDRARILAAGFDAYVPKPVNIRQLPELLHRLLAESE